MNKHDPLDKVANIFCIVVLCIIVYLKIAGIIKLSWFWLLSPIWGLLLIGIVLSIVLCIVILINILIDKKENKDERN